MTAQTGDKKRKRKAARAARWADGFKGYRERCRDLISSLRKTKAAPEDFRAALKRERHRWSTHVAGRQVRA